MQIRVNEQILDFTLEKEKNAGEVLAALEQWLAGSGNRITAISIDGSIITSSMIESIFQKEISLIKILDIYTDSIKNLTLTGFNSLLEEIKNYQNLSFTQKGGFFENWKESSAAQFLFSQYPDIYKLCESAFFKGEIEADTLRSIAEERLREVKDPVNEYINIEPILNEVCDRLVNLPLDIQTGKDLLAAQTIQLFSAITQKIIRIFIQLDTQGFLPKANTNENDDENVTKLFTDFIDILKELLTAYEKQDSVLVGDFAEYEASPRVKQLYTAILQNIQNTKKAEK